MFHLVKIVKVSEKTGEEKLPTHGSPFPAYTAFTAFHVLFQGGQQKTVGLIIKTHGFIRHTELQTGREGITAETVSEGVKVVKNGNEFLSLKLSWVMGGTGDLSTGETIQESMDPLLSQRATASCISILLTSEEGWVSLFPF